MNKLLPLIFCIFTFAHLATARNLKGASQCNLEFWGPTPPPVCETYIDENGQSQLACSQVGPAASRTWVNKANKTFKSAAESLYELDFDGTCKCTLVLYSKANYKGSSYSYAFSKAKNGVIFGNQIWKTANKSYKISCAF